jgi:hypothetical protein
MQMFEVTNYKICEVTGITSFELQWDIGHGIKTDGGNFIDSRDADNYIKSSKRSYILLMFGHYIQHARILFETGTRDFYRKESKITALDRCIKYNDWLQDKPLETICKVILKLDEDMRRILPTPGNPSHFSSESKIMDMIVFCKRELQELPLPKHQKSLVKQV